MITKESFISSSERIPYSKVSIDGLGEVGLRLFRGSEAESIEDDLDKQVAFVLIGEDGNRIFEDSDIEILKEKMPFAYKKEIMEQLHFVNGLEIKQEEVKKN